MQVVIPVILVVIAITQIAGNESVTTSDGIVQLNETPSCDEVKSPNNDCLLPTINSLPNMELTNDHEKNKTFLCIDSESGKELCQNSEAILHNEIYDELTTEAATTLLPSLDDMQAQETFQSFSVALPPSEIFINLEKRTKNMPKSKINQALFSLDTAKRFTAIRAPPPVPKSPSTQVEVMKSVEIPFDSSRFQITNTEERSLESSSSNQFQVISGHTTRLGTMENILQRRERYEANRQSQRRHLNGTTRAGSRSGYLKGTNNANDESTPQNQFPDNFDFNSRILIGNNIVRQVDESTVFGEKHKTPKENSTEQALLKGQNVENYVNTVGTQSPKTFTLPLRTQEVNNASNLPKSPTRMHRRRNKNDIYNPSNTRNFYRSKFRKIPGNYESNAKDDIHHDHSISNPDSMPVSTTTEIYTRYIPRENKSRVRKPYADSTSSNENTSQELLSTVRAYTNRYQRRRTTTTTETPPRNPLASTDMQTEKTVLVSPTHRSRAQEFTQEACTECPKVQSQQEALPSRTPLQTQSVSTHVTTMRSRGTHKYNHQQEYIWGEIPRTAQNSTKPWRKYRLPQHQRDNQQQEQQQPAYQQSQQQEQSKHLQWQHQQLQQLQQQWQQQELQNHELQKQKQYNQGRQEQRGQWQQHQEATQQEVQEQQQQQQQREQQPKHQQWQRHQIQRTHHQPKLQPQWTEPYDFKPHSAEQIHDDFTHTHLPKINTPVEAFTKTQHTKTGGRANRGQMQYHHAANPGQFLHVFHPNEGSTSFIHHGSIPTIDQTGQVEDILLVSYQQEGNLSPFKPTNQQNENSFFY